MANKRQRLARKGFREVFSVQDHVQAAEIDSGAKPEGHDHPRKRNGTKRSRERGEDSDDRGEVGERDGYGVSGSAGKKMKTFARGSGASNGLCLVKKPSRGSKHPLRLQGRRPGEGCFICKATDHTAKTCAERNGKDRNKICLFCRATGHRMRNCPNKSPRKASKFCYNCGEIGHRLSECTEPIKNGGTSFAECFLCKQEGHVSKNCPSNYHGIYPKGGSCKKCGGVTHLAKDCSEKGTGRLAAERDRLQLSNDVLKGVQLFGDRNHIIFRSGDDLEDDFIEERGKNGIGITVEVCSKVDGGNHKTNRKKEFNKKGGNGKEGRGNLASKQKPKVIDFF